VLDELVAGGAAVELLEAVDVEAVVEGLPDGELEADVDVDLEWPLDPHAATSSAGASTKPIRFSIGSG